MSQKQYFKVGQMLLYRGLIKSLEPTLNRVGVSCMTALSKECVCVCDGGQCLPLCTQHVEAHVPPLGSKTHDISSLFGDAGGLVFFQLSLTITTTEN